MLKARIDSDLKDAMLSGDKPLVEVLRGVKSAFLYKEVAEGSRDTGLTEDAYVAVLKKEAKARKDAMSLYEQAGETARYDHEAYQLKIIESYLPEEMSEDQIKSLVAEVLQAIGGEVTMRDMGRVIAEVKSRAPNTDGAKIAAIVKSMLEAK
jgi:uncharacterized protein YqeY